MQPAFIGPAALYPFLGRCEKSPLEKVVLDCGAGGSEPPLTMFFERGYRTHGIDISEVALSQAERFCRKRGIDLNIRKGDMRHLQFQDQSLSFVYSYATICHMSKQDAAAAVKEIARVLKKNGLCYLSFCSVDYIDPNREGAKPSGEYPYKDRDIKGIHSIYEVDEPDSFFADFKILRRVWRRIENFREEKPFSWAEVDYIAERVR
jgi:ubiquinone/menaquinone biosynthesis C-methylase UbiE